MKIKEVKTTTERIRYRAPMKFGGRVVEDVLLLNVKVDVELGDGRTAYGYGSMPLGNVWAWPSQSLSGDQTLAAMLSFGERTAAALESLDLEGHPIELSKVLEGGFDDIAVEVLQGCDLSESIPKLAQLVAASPLDAALHDAYGRAHGKNSFAVLGPTYLAPDLSEWLGKDFEGELLADFVSPHPVSSLPLYHLVGALDPLIDRDIDQRINDGLPETLEEWIRQDELSHLKIKLDGQDLDWDVQRVAAVDKIASTLASEREWNYSLDFNERCETVEYLLELLARIGESAPMAFDRVQYIEQPTSRHLRSAGATKMHAAAKLKPVVIDEALVDLESLLAARDLGYSGVALKACKGQTESLLMAAAAQKYGMFLCVQDLTCPGASFLHSASLAAHIPGIAAIEGNGRQYCPAGNDGWRDQFPGVFCVKQGTIETSCLDSPGLGFDTSSVAF